MYLNIGAGDWEADGWTNLDCPSDYYRDAQSRHEFTIYDIRNDGLPYANNSVDVIYCSHVIEHIETKYIQKMFDECYRVLKKGGILRIVVPDAEFIYDISKTESTFWMDYWNLKSGEKYFQSDFYGLPSLPRNVDYCVHELATPRLRYHSQHQNEYDYINEFENMGRDEFFEFITSGLTYDTKHVRDHINYWSYKKIYNMLKESGFHQIFRMNYRASFCKHILHNELFDNTCPEFSLYVESIK